MTFDQHCNLLKKQKPKSSISIWKKQKLLAEKLIKYNSQIYKFNQFKMVILDASSVGKISIPN